MWINDWIPTLERWKRGYELRVGDIIFDGSGNPQPIKELVTSNEIISRVNIGDGSYIDTHKGELLKVGDRCASHINKDRTHFINISELDNISINTIAGTPKHYVANIDTVNYVNQNLNIPPYILGCLIGNAQKRHKDNEILRNSVDGDGKIPEIYRTAPLRDRKELLAGIMDTNGIFDAGKNSSAFGTNNPLLALDLRELICSLGGTAYIKERNGTGTKYFSYFALPFNPFKDNDREYSKWSYYKSKKYKPLDSIIVLDELETVIPLIRGDEYLQGRWYITKRYEAS